VGENALLLAQATPSAEDRAGRFALSLVTRHVRRRCIERETAIVVNTSREREAHARGMGCRSICYHKKNDAPARKISRLG
jgi:hypothetical protein